ncbi:hypothetical protein Tco_1385066 [Tanacetum coccineum]
MNHVCPNELVGYMENSREGLGALNVDGNVVAVTDLHDITRAVIAAVESAVGIDNDDASSIMQKFWNSAMFPY